MSIVQASDFESGSLRLAKDVWTTDKLSAFISRYEAEYLRKLMGKTLYDLFAADLTGTPSVPQAARFLAIFNANDALIDDVHYVSRGMKDMLTGFLHYEYSLHQSARSTVAGQKKQKAEASEPAMGVGVLKIESFYNEAVDTFEAIQAIMIDDPDTYPELDNYSSMSKSFFGGLL